MLRDSTLASSATDELLDRLDARARNETRDGTATLALAGALRSALRSAAIIERARAGALHRAGGREHPRDRHSPRRPRSLTARRIDSADSGALSRALELVLACLCEGYCMA